jgi:hypothetical protein
MVHKRINNSEKPDSIHAIGQGLTASLMASIGSFKIIGIDIELYRLRLDPTGRKMHRSKYYVLSNDQICILVCRRGTRT